MIKGLQFCRPFFYIKNLIHLIHLIHLIIYICQKINSRTHEIKTNETI